MQKFREQHQHQHQQHQKLLPSNPRGASSSFSQGDDEDVSGSYNHSGGCGGGGEDNNVTGEFYDYDYNDEDEQHHGQSSSSASPLQGRSPIPSHIQHRPQQQITRGIEKPSSAVPYRSVHHRAPLPCERTLGRLQTYSPRRPTTQASKLKRGGVQQIVSAATSPNREDRVGGGGSATPLTRHNNHFRLHNASRVQNHNPNVTSDDNNDTFLPPVLQSPYQPSPPPTQVLEAKLLQFDKITKGSSISATPSQTALRTLNPFSGQLLDVHGSTGQRNPASSYRSDGNNILMKKSHNNNTNIVGGTLALTESTQSTTHPSHTPRLLTINGEIRAVDTLGAALAAGYDDGAFGSGEQYVDLSSTSYSATMVGGSGGGGQQMISSPSHPTQRSHSIALADVSQNSLGITASPIYTANNGENAVVDALSETAHPLHHNANRGTPAPGNEVRRPRQPFQDGPTVPFDKLAANHLILLGPVGNPSSSSLPASNNNNNKNTSHQKQQCQSPYLGQSPTSSRGNRDSRLLRNSDRGSSGGGGVVVSPLEMSGIPMDESKLMNSNGPSSIKMNSTREFDITSPYPTSSAGGGGGRVSRQGGGIDNNRNNNKPHNHPLQIAQHHQPMMSFFQMQRVRVEQAKLIEQEKEEIQRTIMSDPIAMRRAVLRPDGAGRARNDDLVVQLSGRRSTLNFHRRESSRSSSRAGNNDQFSSSSIRPVVDNRIFTSSASPHHHYMEGSIRSPTSTITSSLTRHLQNHPTSAVSGSGGGGSQERRPRRAGGVIGGTKKTPRPPTPPNHTPSPIFPKAIGRTYYEGIYHPIDSVSELQKYFCYEDLARGFQRRPKM